MRALFGKKQFIAKITFVHDNHAVIKKILQINQQHFFNFFFQGEGITESRNGDIIYSLDDESSETFAVDRRTGRITLKAPLDYEQRQNWKVGIQIAKSFDALTLPTPCLK